MASQPSRMSSEEIQAKLARLENETIPQILRHQEKQDEIIEEQQSIIDRLDAQLAQVRQWVRPRKGPSTSGKMPAPAPARAQSKRKRTEDDDDDSDSDVRSVSTRKRARTQAPEEQVVNSIESEDEDSSMGGLFTEEELQRAISEPTDSETEPEAESDAKSSDNDDDDDDDDDDAPAPESSTIKPSASSQISAPGTASREESAAATPRYARPTTRPVSGKWPAEYHRMWDLEEAAAAAAAAAQAKARQEAAQQAPTRPTWSGKSLPEGYSYHPSEAFDTVEGSEDEEQSEDEQEVVEDEVEVLEENFEEAGEEEANDNLEEGEIQEAEPRLLNTGRFFSERASAMDNVPRRAAQSGDDTRGAHDNFYSRPAGRPNQTLSGNTGRYGQGSQARPGKASGKDKGKRKRDQYEETSQPAPKRPATSSAVASRSATSTTPQQGRPAPVSLPLSSIAAAAPADYTPTRRPAAQNAASSSSTAPANSSRAPAPQQGPRVGGQAPRRRPANPPTPAGPSSAPAASQPAASSSQGPRPGLIWRVGRRGVQFFPPS